ncbi:hypothetical protein IPF86_02340 [Candidatus Nomurabacteria bacterium]|nr:MAG: hypothetical protein IPF86_02340 [Candidatus Nomurabacteria bacterium]
MNEFTAKKLGEVIAFMNIGKETFSKTQAVLEPVLGEGVFADMAEKCSIYEENIANIVNESGVKETTNEKRDETLKELRDMRDEYLEHGWQEASEILEWHGFYFGACMVHFAVIKGAAETISNEPLMMLADEALDAYHSFLDIVAGELQTIGQDKAK